LKRSIIILPLLLLLACKKPPPEVRAEPDASTVVAPAIVIDVTGDGEPKVNGVTFTDGSSARARIADAGSTAEVRGTAATPWGRAVRALDVGKQIGITTFVVAAGDRRTRPFELPRATVGMLSMTVTEITVTREGEMFVGDRTIASSKELAAALGDASVDRLVIRADTAADLAKLIDVIAEVQRIGRPFAIAIGPMRASPVPEPAPR
jgi:biopolymer transport protein ExbD